MKQYRGRTVGSQRSKTIRVTPLTLDVLAAVMYAGGTGIHGYELMKHLGVSHGSIYTTLSRLLGAGLVSVEDESVMKAAQHGRQPRRLYRLTESGRWVLDRERATHIASSPFNRFVS